MSQYPPPPHQPPSPYPPTYPPGGMVGYHYPAQGPDPLAPAKRAGIMLFVLSGILLLCGGCLGVAVAAIPIDTIITQAHLDTLSLPPGIDIHTFVRLIYIAISVSGVVTGIALGGLGFLVRKAVRWAVVTAIILCSGILLFCGLNIISGLIGASGNPQALIGALIITIPCVLLAVTLVWLFQALRIDQRALQYQYQLQMWQYQQQMAAYSSGYVAPPVPTGEAWPQAPQPPQAPPAPPAPPAS